MLTTNLKNIAVIVAGIDEEYQNGVINGINSYARKNNVNVSYFTAFGGVLSNSSYDAGEYNIYNLINFSKFDGAILMTNTIGDFEIREKIIGRVKESGIPAVVFDCSDYPEFYNVKIENSKAMREIIQHVICEHKAKNIAFISGPLANPEATDRYNAFVELMNEYNLPIDEKSVYFGEFRNIDGKKAVNQFIQSGIEIPDAIICANDAMALAAVNELERYGYHVPEDIIVTGFDNTYHASHYSPAITTVARPLFNAGYKACDILDKLVGGVECEKTTLLSATPIFSESCGCSTEYDVNDFKSYKKSTYKIIDSFRTEISLLNRVTSSLADSESIQENIEKISSFLNEIDCEKFSLCLCSDWKGAFKSKDKIRKDGQTGYTRNMTAPLVWTKDGQRAVNLFSSAEMFPEKQEGYGNISYFLPLHFRERCLGYYIIENSEFPIDSLLCHSLIMNISNSVENIRKLFHLNNAISELDKLYVIDPLCRIYNRNGFIRLADVIFKKSIAEKEKVMICFIDMDGLKLINDNYGHNEGDFALKKLADIIKECSEESMVCARFGGDEFIIFGIADEDAAYEIESRLTSRLSEMNSILNKPYEFSASIGMCVTEVHEDDKLFSLITMADDKMYEQKKLKKTSRYLRRT
jgi:diguanylate cyclase (GGDEF)-like protein